VNPQDGNIYIYIYIYRQALTLIYSIFMDTLITSIMGITFRSSFPATAWLWFCGPGHPVHIPRG